MVACQYCKLSQTGSTMWNVYDDQDMMIVHQTFRLKKDGDFLSRKSHQYNVIIWLVDCFS